MTSASRTAAHTMRKEVTGIPPRNRHPVPSAGRACTRAVRAAQVAMETSSGATSLTTARTSLATDCLATRPIAERNVHLNTTPVDGQILLLRDQEQIGCSPKEAQTPMCLATTTQPDRRWAASCT